MASRPPRVRYHRERVHISPNGERKIFKSALERVICLLPGVSLMLFDSCCFKIILRYGGYPSWFRNPFQKPPAKTAKTLFCFHGHFNYQTPQPVKFLFLWRKIWNRPPSTHDVRPEVIDEEPASSPPRSRASEGGFLLPKNPWREGTERIPEPPWVWFARRKVHLQINHPWIYKGKGSEPTKPPGNYVPAVNLQGCRYVWVDDKISSPWRCGMS